MPRSLATISYLLLAIAPAVAQTSDATAGGIPWTLLIVGIIIVGGIWWYVTRMRGPRV